MVDPREEPGAALSKANGHAVKPDRGEGLPPAAGLTDLQFELILLLSDGELARDAVRRSQAEELIARLEVARTIYQSLLASKVALREHVLVELAERPVQADMSMLRGRIMTRLPAEPRAASPAAESTGHLLDWLRALGFGRAVLGLAALALVLVGVRALVGAGPELQAPGPLALAQDGAAALTAALDEPDVIIEEIDVDSGSVAVTPGQGPSQSTVIWHFQGQGEG